MTIFRTRVALHERVIVHEDERPVRYLTPGKHWIVAPFRRVRLLRLDTRTHVASLRAEQLELVPSEDLRILRLAPHERAVLVERGRPIRWLGTGEHQVWTVDRSLVGERLVASVEVEILDTSTVGAEPLSADRAALAPSLDYVEVTVPQGAVAVRYVDGVLDEILSPGRHAAWTTQRSVKLGVIETRQRVLAVGGQEIMTKDRVTLRLNLSAEYRVADPRRLVTVASDADEVLHLAVQLAAREAVAGRTLDELLASRDTLAGELAGGVARRAEAVGLEVHSLALRDVILPGDMKALLNRVIEASKEAEANVISRREEAAATRSLAQTAKVLADNPVLMRLKELEAYRDLADKIGHVHVVLGDGAVPTLQLKGS